MTSTSPRRRGAAVLLSVIAAGGAVLAPTPAQAATGTGTLKTQNFAFEEVGACPDAAQPNATRRFTDDGVPVTVQRSYVSTFTGPTTGVTTTASGYSRMRLKATDLSAETATITGSTIATGSAVSPSPFECYVAAGAGVDGRGTFAVPAARTVTITLASDGGGGLVGASVTSPGSPDTPVLSASLQKAGTTTVTGTIPAGVVRFRFYSDVEGQNYRVEEQNEAVAGRVTVRFAPVAGS